MLQHALERLKSCELQKPTELLSGGLVLVKESHRIKTDCRSERKTNTGSSAALFSSQTLSDAVILLLFTAEYHKEAAAGL